MAPKKKKTDDKLTSTAKAIGSTLGMLAVKAGIATPKPEVSRKAEKKAAKKSPPQKATTKAK